MILLNIPCSQLDGINNRTEFTAGYSENGLVELWFPGAFVDGRPLEGVSLSSQVPPMETLARRLLPAKIRKWHRITVSAVLRVLSGRLPEVLPPLDIKGTPFQKAVWQALREIPLGQTRSYGDIARAIGRPLATRAVGGACGANPIPLLVPCHRVLAANGKIGGFSGGLDWKRRLLASEGVCVDS